MKRLLTALLLACVGLTAPAYAQSDGARALLAKTSQWSGQWADGWGDAGNGRREVRKAQGIAFGQDMVKAINSNDATVIESVRVAPPGGIGVVTGKVKDGQDEGTTRVQVFDFGGTELLDRTYRYKGPRTNGKVKSWSLIASDFGKTGWRGITVRYTTTTHPDHSANLNGISVAHQYQRDCPPTKAAKATAGKREAKASKARDQRDSRKGSSSGNGKSKGKGKN